MTKEQNLKKELGQFIVEYIINQGLDPEKFFPKIKKILDSPDVDYSDETKAGNVVIAKLKAYKGFFG